MKIEKNNTNTKSAGMGTTPEDAVPNDVLHSNISDPIYTIYGSTDSELKQLAQEPLLKMYAEVGPEIYDMISRTNTVLKAVIDLAKEICSGDQ